MLGTPGQGRFQKRPKERYHSDSRCWAGLKRVTRGSRDTSDVTPKSGAAGQAEQDTQKGGKQTNDGNTGSKHTKLFTPAWPVPERLACCLWLTSYARQAKLKMVHTSQCLNTAAGSRRHKKGLQATSRTDPNNDKFVKRLCFIDAHGRETKNNLVPRRRDKSRQLRS